MGIRPGVSMTEWPQQSSHVGKRVRVCFGYDMDILIGGEIVRDDEHVTIIKLDDGRYVLDIECQYSHSN